MDWLELQEYIQKGEDQNLHFISNISSKQELGPHLVAMANNPKGGTIFLGLDIINYHLIGTEWDEDWIKNIIKEFCSPQFDLLIDSVYRNNKQILCIKIPESIQQPYAFKNQVYIRDNQTTRKASEEEITKMRENHIISYQPPPSPPIESNFPTASLSDNKTNSQQDTLMLNYEPIQNKINQSQASSINISEKLSEPKLNHRQKKALEFVQQNTSIKNKQYRALFSVSHKTAHIELVEMVRYKLLKSSGSGRSTCYILPSSN